jgi:hypothetical protein
VSAAMRAGSMCVAAGSVVVMTGAYARARQRV